MNKVFMMIWCFISILISGCSDCRPLEGLADVKICYNDFTRSQRLLLRDKPVVNGLIGVMFSDDIVAGNAISSENKIVGDGHYFILNLDDGSIAWFDFNSLNKTLVKKGYQKYDMRYEINIFEIRQGCIGKNPRLDSEAIRRHETFIQKNKALKQ